MKKVTLIKDFKKLEDIFDKEVSILIDLNVSKNNLLETYVRYIKKGNYYWTPLLGNLTINDFYKIVYLIFSEMKADRDGIFVVSHDNLYLSMVEDVCDMINNGNAPMWLSEQHKTVYNQIIKENE